MSQLKKLFIFFVAVSLLGCTSTKFSGNKKFLGKYEGLQKGVTTKKEVIALLGKPTNVDHRSASQEELVYDYVTTKSQFKAFKGCKDTVQTERLIVSLEDGILKDFQRDSLENEGDFAPCPGTGNGYTAPRPYQPAQTYTPPPAYHNWGMPK